MNKHTLPTLALLITAGQAVAAPAPAPAWTQTGNLAIASDYVFRGVSQIGSSSAMALSGGADLAHTSGFAAGAWFANQNFNSNDGNDTLEADLYASYTAKVGGFDLSVGAITYNYPGASAYNTVEGNVGVAISGVTLRYSHAFTDYFGVANSDGTGYVDLAYSVTASDITLGLHYGWTLGSGAQDDYEDYKVSLAYPVLGYTATLAYTDANLGSAAQFNGKALDKGLTVFSLSRTF